MTDTRLAVHRVVSILASCGLLANAFASNHLDAPLVGNPQANIGDMYAWMAADGQHLNLVMDIVGASFSDKLRYVFIVDSGPEFGHTTATTKIVCRFPDSVRTDCKIGNLDRAQGDASQPRGLESRHHRFRVFAGLRDDPFFNNVTGTRAAYQVAFAALDHGATKDIAACPAFDKPTADSILDQWRHTEGGPARNFLAHWTTSAIVISVDLGVVDRGGKTLAVWGVTRTAARQWDRFGRPLTKNALLGLTDPDGADVRMKDAWNRATPSTSAGFVLDLERSLAFYDGLDGVCGNQLLAARGGAAPRRYRSLANLLADDRLWINASSGQCKQFFAVELANVASRADLTSDCGGRTLTSSAANIWRSLMVRGEVTGIDDGLVQDEHVPSNSEFPFLVPPDAEAINHRDKGVIGTGGYKE